MTRYVLYSGNTGLLLNLHTLKRALYPEAGVTLPAQRRSVHKIIFDIATQIFNSKQLLPVGLVSFWRANRG